MSSSLLTGLAAFWSLNESSNGSAPVSRVDRLGVNNLTDNNTVASVAAIVSNGASLVAANSESLSCADNAALRLGTPGAAYSSDFTIAFWIKPALSSSSATAVCKWGAATKREWRVFFAESAGTTTARFFISPDGTTSATTVDTTVTNNAWNHVVCWYDSTTKKHSIQANNGSIVTLAGTVNTVWASDEQFRLGVFGGSGTYFNGALDEVGRWSRLLTVGERAALYGSGAGLAYPFSTFSPSWARDCNTYIPAGAA